MKLLIKTFEAVFGSLKQDSLEHRLFNTLSFFNAITNFGGAFNYLDLPNEWALFSLHLISSFLFMVFYLFSRFRSIYHSLYWPFVLTMIVFLFSNVLINAGSMGGAIFYFIAAIVIASILARSAWQAILTYVIFMGFIGALYAIEMYRPEWIRPYANPADRPYDVFGNFMFMLIFTAAIVQVLTRNLHLERRKSDNLLLNIMPASIADELKKHDRVRPVTYDLASVLFTDFVGFTGIAERLNAEELLRELDACFSRFDNIMQKHGMEKIKTIGDAYMAAGGLPDANRTNPVDAVLAGLEIRDFMAEMRASKRNAGQPYWELRLGIHSGPLMAGVIGHQKFAYDVWGDTVNTASRMESSGVAGEINVSSTTYDHIKHFFACEYRGKIQAKNKGAIDMFLVQRILPDLSADTAGTQPNERFQERYQKLRQIIPGNMNKFFFFCLTAF